MTEEPDSAIVAETRAATLQLLREGLTPAFFDRYQAEGVRSELMVLGGSLGPAQCAAGQRQGLDEMQELALSLVAPSLARMAAFHVSTASPVDESDPTERDRLIGSAALLAVVWARLTTGVA
ncbi:MAG: hypothetical protein LC118_10960 [Dehalococcoidia bacterium]|nr:hypothetical protein [Dehalococcoidia bacterium]